MNLKVVLTLCIRKDSFPE